MSAGRQPAIGDYGLIGDCHGSALVSQAASIDWCCLPRFDSGSCFGRLLDWERGGFCAVTLEHAGEVKGRSSYLGETLVLETELEAPGGAVRVLDCLLAPEPDGAPPASELVRIIECTRGPVEVAVEIAPRFDYGSIRPWLRRVGMASFTAIGGDDGLQIWSDGSAEIEGDSILARAALRPRERLSVLIGFVRPHLLDDADARPPAPEEVQAKLHATLQWWEQWRGGLLGADQQDRRGITRSALTLKALSYTPTGAIVAAPSCSLPETLGGARNWDYRYSWIRDSVLTADALAGLGCEREARRFRHFIIRSSAGHAEDVQVLFGIGGERRISEQELPLAGYHDSRPVRIGNGAAGQLQLDTFGALLHLAWRWHQRGHPPEDDEWRFLAEVVEFVIEHWHDPDRGFWEWRGEPAHFVHSKAGCWSAVDRGLAIAEASMRQRPLRRWTRARNEIREAIEAHGYDSGRGVFVQRFDEPQLDSVLLRLPVLGFIAYDDERMVRTVDAIREELTDGGFLRRYAREDGLPGEEGAFLPCSFWLAECYANQGRVAQAREVFDSAVGAANHLGLFSEEIDSATRGLRGNFPQGLTHLSHISAALSLARAEAGTPEEHERLDGRGGRVAAVPQHD